MSIPQLSIRSNEVLARQFVVPKSRVLRHRRSSPGTFHWSDIHWTNKPARPYRLMRVLVWPGYHLGRLLRDRTWLKFISDVAHQSRGECNCFQLCLAIRSTISSHGRFLASVIEGLSNNQTTLPCQIGKYSNPQILAARIPITMLYIFSLCCAAIAIILYELQ